ncbi:MAG: hypothetical protein K2P81_09595 [Bacteriovoracaceae bacterium]|nr:hypothetical protein [Bacteriovoracaceae bacterium]
MKIFFFILLVTLSSPSWAKGAFKFFTLSTPLSQELKPRKIFVYLPDGYETSGLSYSVLYMHDGQNLYDPTRAFLGQTWRAEETLNSMIEANLISPIIVVGIDNTEDRLKDYTEELYLDYMAKELKPLIDQSFRTKAESSSTAIMGSSLGGLISLKASLAYPKVFGLVGALSPSIWWKQREILDQFQSSKIESQKIYIDSGTEGGEAPQDVIDLQRILFSQGYRRGENLFLYIQQGALHQEKFWAQRFPIALRFLFGK